MIRDNKKSSIKKSIYYISFSLIMLIIIILELYKFIKKIDPLSQAIKHLNITKCPYIIKFNQIMFWTSKPFLLFIYSFGIFAITKRSYSKLDTFEKLFLLMIIIKLFNITFGGIQPLILNCSNLKGINKTIYFFLDNFLLYYIITAIYFLIVYWSLNACKNEIANEECFDLNSEHNSVISNKIEIN